MNEPETKNAVVTSADIFADNTCTTVTLMLDYGDGTQQCGPHVLTIDLLNSLLKSAGTRSWSEIVGRAVRVRRDPPGPMGPLDLRIRAIGHFLDDNLWCTL